MDPPKAKDESVDIGEKCEPPFKKPILIGKIGQFPKKIEQKKYSPEQNQNLEGPSSGKIECTNEHKDSEEGKVVNNQSQNVDTVKNTIATSIPTIPYLAPSWSGMPQSNNKEYGFEVLKNGAIIENLSLMDKPFWVFGRMINCHICMQHPTISRYHAALQYRKEGSEQEPPGFYLYDLGSTHGTFLNKKQIKPRVYVRMQVGHMLRLGCSQRTYILNGPDEDAEEESELTVTELKAKRAEEIRKREEAEREALLKIEKEREERRKKEEERGVDWGLGGDSEDEEVDDLSENPFAQTNNEELYLDDPKKALRGFFEREGLELEYDCSEHNMGQFLCKVELPLDDDLGRPIVAEALHKGKKKEAVIQCALEACRILDRYGVLRQATHESRKRKAKNWEENDYYDSDEDTFLDRTGTVEKKRQMRMNSKAPQKVETYENLLEKEKDISSAITDLEKQLQMAQSRQDDENNANPEADSLDVFMKELKKSKPDKQTISKIKLELVTLKKEHSSVIKLINIAKPASLPPLSPNYASLPSTSKDSGRSLPMIGKMKKIGIQLPPKLSSKQLHSSVENDDMEEEVEEEEEKEPEPMEEGEDDKNKSELKEREAPTEIESTTGAVQNPPATEEYSSATSSDEDLDMQCAVLAAFRPIKSFHETLTFKKFEKLLKTGLPSFAIKYQEKLEKILDKLKRLAANEDRMHVDWKMLSAKKRKVMKLISDLRSSEYDEKLEHRVSSELNRILSELNLMTEEKYKVISKVKKMGDEIKTISEDIDKDFHEYKKGMVKRGDKCECSSKNEGEENSLETDEKKKKKNQRRIQQRQEKAEVDRQRGYEEDANRENYNMWVPPSDQSGDGKTSLNEKYGY